MKINLKISDLLYKTGFKKKDNLPITFFIIFYLGYLLFLCARVDMSYDEPYSLTTSDSLSEVIHLSYNFEFQPPGYFVILSLWRIINDGIFFSRLLSLAFTLLSAFFLFKTSRLIFNKIFTKWVVVLFLLNPFTVYTSIEIRLYSLMVLLTMVDIYLFYLIYFYKKGHLKIVFIIVSALGAYTQYFFVFLVASFALVLIIKKDWRSFVNYILLSSLIAILFIPNLFFIKKQFNVYPNSLEVYTFIDRIKSIIIASSDFFVLNTNYFIGRIGRWAIRIAFVSLIVITGYKYFKKVRTDKCEEIINLRNTINQTIILLCFFLAMFSFSNIPFAVRYLVILFPFHIILLVAFGIFKNRTRNIIYGLYAMISLITVIGDHRSPYIKSYAFKSIATYTKQIQNVNEPLLFLNNDLNLGMKYIYDNVQSFISLPEFQYNYNLYTNYVKDTTELNQLISKIRSDSPSYLVITGTDLGYLRNKDLTNEMIDSYFGSNFAVQIDTTFEGYNNKVDFIRLRRIIKK